jgi:hypothetical protein
MNRFLFLTACFFCFNGCSIQARLLSQSTPPRPIAFPGAEGFGKYATGGRGGKIMIVSNCNDNGVGSFRRAATAKGKRIIVFTTSGTIHLKSKLKIYGDVTIAGQTAPGDGICIADYPVKIAGDNIIIRYMRFRMGDRHEKSKMIDGSGNDDALGGIRFKQIIVDHCSMSWSTDEVFSIYAGDSTTVQWNLISEPLNYSYHFEKGGKDFQKHGYGGIWGGQHFSAHYNLFAHCYNRTPKFDGVRNSKEENVDFRNNVIYNWGRNNIYGGEGGKYNIVNNYYKYGPSTMKIRQFSIVEPWSQLPKLPFGEFYVSGNYVDGATDVSADNRLGVWMGTKGTDDDKRKALSDTPLVVELLTTKSAEDAYDDVLAGVGASYARDTLDVRVINDVKNRTGRIIDVQGGYSRRSEYAETKSAWPVLESSEAPTDSDNDGIPDKWELSNNLNPSDYDDAIKNSIDNEYTNIEVYLNSIVN